MEIINDADAVDVDDDDLDISLGGKTVRRLSRLSSSRLSTRT